MKKTKKSSIFTTIILILILGLTIGTLIFLSLSLSSLNTLRDLNQSLDLDSPKYNNTSLVIQDPRRVYISQDLKIDETLNYLNESVVGIFLKNEKDSYSLGEELFSGLVISSDGWVMVNILGQKDFNLGIVNKIEDYVLVSKKEKKVQEIEEVLDFSSEGFLLVKIKKATNLPVRNFSNISDLNPGQTVLLYNFQGELALNAIKSIDSGEDLKFSDQYYSQINLSQDIDDNFAQAYIFNLSGDLIALINKNLEVESVHAFRPLIYGFLKNKEMVPLKFGLWYLDLKNVIDPNLPLKGNIVSRVVAGSLAESSGLIAGDIITQVNNHEINDKANFNDVLNNFVPGDKLSIIVLREGQLMELKVELK